MNKVVNKNVFIKNIYYMLSYTIQNLSKLCDDFIDTEEFDNIYDLFALILYNGISHQIKRGLYHEYEEQKEQLSSLKGKINVSDTIKTNCLINKKLVCEFEEYTSNTLYNKILKSTCEFLLYRGNLKQQNKKILKKILMAFNNVKSMSLREVNWEKLSFHRNNITYKILLNICYLIYQERLLNEQKGSIKLGQFLDDRNMHKLYEKFILEFYRKHFPELSPSASYIKWNVEKEDFLSLLPSMQSDIMLKFKNKVLIIDAKFYSHTMQEKYGKKSFISANMYQIYTYVKNEDKTHSGNVSGLILYAKTNEELVPNNEYILDGNKFIIRTLDLDDNWDKIYKSLLDIGLYVKEVL